jgi:hypothetical protein
MSLAEIVDLLKVDALASTELDLSTKVRIVSSSSCSPPVPVTGSQAQAAKMLQHCQEQRYPEMEEFSHAILVRTSRHVGAEEAK